MVKKILFPVAFIFLSFAVAGGLSAKVAFAAPQCHAIATGNWSDPAIWSNCHGVGGLPDATDIVSISTDSIVTVDVSNAVARSLYVYDSVNASRGYTFTPSGVLTVTDYATLSGSSGSGSQFINVGDGTLILGGNLRIDGGILGTATVTVNNGTLTVGGSILMSGGLNASLVSTGTSTINVGGDLTNGVLTTSGTGTINFNGTGAQEVSPYATFNNVIISNTGGTVTIDSGATVIGGDLSVTSGDLYLDGGTLDVLGDTTISSGATWSEGPGMAVTFAGNLENEGTFTADTGNHTFTGTGKTISGGSGIDIPNLVISGTITNHNTHALTASSSLSGAGTLTNASSAILEIGGDLTITTLVASIPGNFVKYTKAGDQTIRAIEYSLLAVKNGGVKTIPSGITVDFALVINVGNVVDLTGTTTTQVLYMNNASQDVGSWGATGSGAANINDTFFSGTGTVNVTGLTATITIDSISNDTGVSSSDFITKTAGQTVNVTMSFPYISGETVEGSVDGGATYTNISSMASGTSVVWTGVTLASGTNTLKVRVTLAPSDISGTQVYTLDTDAPGTIAATPSAGTFSSSQSVTLSSSGATTVYYTTDGTSPSCSSGTLYSGPITVSSSETINAIACDDAGNETTGSFTYTIHTGGGSVFLIPTLPVISANLLGNLTQPQTTTGRAGEQNTSKELFPKNLYKGMTDPDVKRLQEYLNGTSFMVAKTGPGSPGHETSRFGPATAKALMLFQKSIGITPATGGFGPKTRAYVNTHSH